MEMIDVLDLEGKKTGEVRSKDDAHKYGLWHAAAHVWFINSKNELLLQLRSLAKENNPGKWDISVAGHVSAGENSLTTAIRETEEEIGVSLKSSDFQTIGTVIQSSVTNNGSYINNEFNDVYLVKKDFDTVTLTLQPGEVDELKYVSLEDLKSMVSANDKSLVLHPEEFTLLFSYLETMK